MLLNEEFPGEKQDEVEWNQGLIKDWKSRLAINKINSRKAIGSDKLPVEVWKALGENGRLFKMIMR